MQQILGILGGMGPEATADFFQRVIANTPANSDQDHIRILIDNNPQVPDRTQAILGQGKSPVPALTSMAKNLESNGADLLAMPCNTAHYFHADISQEIDIPLLNMIFLAVEYIAQKLDSNSRIGILATSGTLQTEIYQQELQNQNLQPWLPAANYQEDIMEAIYRIKRQKKDNKTRKLVKQTIENLESQNVKAIIAGCTELPLLPLKNFTSESFIINPGEILARKAVQISRD